jgi:hypothetical protein
MIYFFDHGPFLENESEARLNLFLDRVTRSNFFSRFFYFSRIQ